jgi:CelD/BcsL family acetyltransferase involved in cellulose biosynthesis
MQKNSQEYKIRVVQDIADFQKLEAEWNILIENYKHHVPFLCYDWFKIWLKHFLNGNKLFILLAYKGDHLSAIAPFIIKNEKFRGIINAKKIELIGNVYSPVRNFIFLDSNNGTRKAILINIFDYLKSQFKDWDIIELEPIPEEDPTFTIIDLVVSEAGLKKRQYSCFGDWYLDEINYSGDEYIKRRPKNTRLELKRRKKRLEEIGKLGFHIGEDKDKLDYYINIYHEVRNKSWKHPEADNLFQRDFRQLAVEKRWLRFGFLFLNDSPIAAQLRIVSKGVAYFIDTVHDPNYNQFAPGTILRAEFTKYLIDVDKVEEIDNLRGDEPYKKEWTPKRRERKGILIFNDTANGRFLGFLMIRLLPIIEKNQNLMAAKNRLAEYLKKHRQQ